MDQSSETAVTVKDALRWADAFDAYYAAIDERGPAGNIDAEGHDPTMMLRYQAHKSIAGICRLVRDLSQRLDEAQLRSIEASNPGIDMDEVRRFRASPSGRTDP